MTQTHRARLLTLALAVSVAACSSGGDSSQPTNQPPPPPPIAAVQDGAFKDSNVLGLDFVSGAQSGTTDAGGRYRCETGNTVSFSIGAVELGSMACTTLASPPALIGDGSLDNVESLNMARLLLMLDGDVDPRNGIVISEMLQTMAESWPQIDFGAADFDAEVVIPIADIMSVEQRMAELPSASIARDHLQDTLSCAYSGAFIGQLSGSSTAAVTLQVGYEQFFSNVDDVYWTAWDAENGTRVTLVDYEVAVPPSFDTTPVDPSVQVTGGFDTPDSISGTWNIPGESASGTYVANRIGGNTAEIRVTGSFNTNDGGSGVLVLDIDGNTITGEAFEAFEGTLYTVTGTRNGDDIEVTAVGGGETIVGTGTLSRFDRNGVPRRVFGDLDIGGSFFGVACKLN